MTTTPKIELNILENAFDYLLSAATIVSDSSADPKTLKYAILHLDAGIELLLKARLAEEHWSLVFADVDKATKQTLSSGDFKSVDVKTVITRLEEIAGLTLRKARTTQVTDLRALRNRIQHFAVHVEIAVARSRMAFGCNFILEFCHDHLPGSIPDHAQVVGEIKRLLLGCEEYVRERMADLKAQLESEPDLQVCPDCSQEAVLVGKGSMPRCLFCSEEKQAKLIAERMSEAEEVWNCPECGSEAVAWRILNNDDSEYYCVCCGESGQYDQCQECNELFSNPDQDPMCGVCWDLLMEKD